MSNNEDQGKGVQSGGIKTEVTEAETIEVALLEKAIVSTETAEIKATVETERIEQDNIEVDTFEQSNFKENMVKEMNEIDAAGIVQGVGHQLRAARIARNMSIGEVSRQLRLSAKQIEAIEKEDFEKLHGRTFLRGFVRNYANLLQLDPAPILQLLPSALPTNLSRNITHQPKITPYSSDWQWNQRSSNRGRGLSTSLKMVLLILLSLVIYGIHQSIDWGRTSALNDEIETDISIKNESTNGQAKIALKLPLSPVVSTSNQNNNLDGNDQGILHFKFNDESWVEVKDSANEIIFKQINAGGMEQVVRGKRPLTLVIGKAAGVDLSYNNRSIDLAPYTSESEGVARLTLE
ncbi:MAG: helix-turn-helix domain-containing protein [Nitrosomonas sp.]|nr:helix-turn-helix domain-containing protein [Nitrosomonas sp.]